MEIWDVLDEKKRTIGRCVRGTELLEGQYHLIVTIWVMNETGKLLVTQRAMEKSFAYEWENTAGSVLAGEDSITGALRELFEETGIVAKKEELKLIDQRKGLRTFWDSWFTKTSLPEDAVRLQEGETIDYRWVTIDELEAMIADGELAAPVASRYRKVKDALLEAMK